MILVGKKLYTPIKTLKSRHPRVQNLLPQTTWCVENINPDHDRNVLNTFNSVTKISMVSMFRFTQVTTNNINSRHEIFLRWRVSSEASINFPESTIRKPLRYWFHDIISIINTKPNIRLCYPIVNIFKNICLLFIKFKGLLKMFKLMNCLITIGII